MRSDLVWVTEEAVSVAGLLAQILPKRIDGREAVEEMQSSGCRNWRQMEWPGFWVECRVEQHLENLPGLTRGPTYGNVDFDLELRHVWDLKTHSETSSSITPLNDQEAVTDCIQERGGIGYIIVNGVPTPDFDGSFKRWHDEAKGKKSAYVLENEARGASSRQRKAAFSFTSIQCVWIRDQAALRRGLVEGWLTGFQEGMRNSNGTPRRAKFSLDLSKMPESVVLHERTIS